jgi:RNA polymerase sigma-70 factor (ECF subfamily)
VPFPPCDAALADRRPCLSAACPLPPDDRRSCPHDGDGEAALEQAFRVHGGALLRYLRRKTGADEAGDLVQEVFARAAGSPQRSRLTNPGGFLRRIAQNLLIDRARKQRSHSVVLFPLLDDRDAFSPPEQEWNLVAGDLIRQYETAVEGMPPKTRRVFLMHRVDEMSYREIHQRLGISIATVEYHMIKALGHIAKVVDAGR